MKRSERVKVVKGYVVRATVKREDGISVLRQIGRRYHARSAAEHLREICGYPDAYVSESMGYDDLTHDPIA